MQYVKVQYFSLTGSRLLPSPIQGFRRLVFSSLLVSLSELLLPGEGFPIIFLLFLAAPIPTFQQVAPAFSRLQLRVLAVSSFEPAQVAVGTFLRLVDLRVTSGRFLAVLFRLIFRLPLLSPLCRFQF